ncbi:putative 54S ribosomal protein [Clavispora lusitaniae]|uniref:54S ribosomal protein n=1 Tax=Clavispora lusitaniae TaxID=36911 RepID=A0ACD0WIV5_CLALS|nr:putative 54S ribosomal protein [Clavispora lusitaniae]QFZ33594.1 putative 54S ribosomal protein [Clavispora lusitaniae]QFZ39265.1 putative 54S ribosomal protein [Clavispora lusitaniae]QFZ44947.1 putative 54S ribosomal protein [Clavispora lusitaniae]QFZ50624.1 putative 54S ribosomal protein [Clavispora lusitaniae]
MRVEKKVDRKKKSSRTQRNQPSMRHLSQALFGAIRPSFNPILNSGRAFLSVPRFFSTASPRLQTAVTPIYSINDRKTTKHVLSRKTFLVDYYKHLNDTNDIVLYVHHNNLVKNDNVKVRSDFQKLGVKMTYIRNRLYDVYLRSSHEEDPALHKNTLKNKKVQHPLSVLLNGPTAVITIPKCEPSVVEQVMKILKQAGEKLILIGARIETSIYNIDDLDKFKSLPNKEQMQSQLAGLLTVLGGAGLVRTLESNGTMLYLTLEQRRKDQDPSSEEQEN